MPRRATFHVRAEEEQLIGLAPLGDDAWDGDAYQKTPPLGIKLTGYRLLNVGVILVFCVLEAALAHCGQSFALTMLDWVAGALLAIILYSVGQLKTWSEHPRWLLFFHVDWAPEILEAMKFVEVPFARQEYIPFFNKLNCYAQDRRPRGLQVCNWTLDVPVDLLRRHLHRHYLSALMIALIYITLPCFERSFLLVVP